MIPLVISRIIIRAIVAYTQCNHSPRLILHDTPIASTPGSSAEREQSGIGARVIDKTKAHITPSELMCTGRRTLKLSSREAWLPISAPARSSCASFAKERPAHAAPKWTRRPRQRGRIDLPRGVITMRAARDTETTQIDMVPKRLGRASEKSGRHLPRASAGFMAGRRTEGEVSKYKQLG